MHYVWGSLFVVCVFVFGCEKPIHKRQYKEIFSESHKNGSLPNDDMFSRMPQDDIHAGLKTSGITDMSNMQNPERLEQVKTSVDKTPLSWEVPKGWIEKQGNGLRLATFTGTDPSAMFETTIVSLGGPAGGIGSNVERWMKQLNLTTPNSQEFDSFIKQQERFSTLSNLPVTLVDLTKLQDAAPLDSPSMIAAIIERDDAQIFVKMTGSKAAVLKNLDDFKTLINSIKVNP